MTTLFLHSHIQFITKSCGFYHLKLSEIYPFSLPGSRLSSSLRRLVCAFLIESSLTPLTNTASSTWNALPLHLPCSFLIVINISAHMFLPQKGRRRLCSRCRPMHHSFHPFWYFSLTEHVSLLFHLNDYVSQTNLKYHEGSMLSITSKPLYLPAPNTVPDT